MTNIDSNDNIRILEWKEHIRKRPFMYIGKIGNGSSPDDGIYTLLKEVIDNVIDEYAVENGRIIIINIGENGISVQDAGRGIPLERLNELVSKIDASAKYESKVIKNNIGMSGWGLKIVNVLSSKFRIQSSRDGQTKISDYEYGELIKDLPIESSEEGQGTSITFIPDNQIFGNYNYRFEHIEEIVKNYNFIYNKLTIILNGVELDPENGLKSLIERHINKNQPILYPIININTNEFDFAVVHRSNIESEKYLSFVNGHNTSQGGTHLAAFKEEIVKTIRDFYNKDFDASDVRASILAVISIKVIKPVFENQSKRKLSSQHIEPEGQTIQKIIESSVSGNLVNYLYMNPETAKIILNKISQQRSKREKESQKQKQKIEQELSSKEILGRVKIQDIIKQNLQEQVEFKKPKQLTLRKNPIENVSYNYDQDVNSINSILYMKDDWRQETQIRLKLNLIYSTLEEKCKEDPAGQQVLTLVDDAVAYAYQRTKTIIKHMGEFTLHDSDHLFRVLKLMESILSKNIIEKLTIPELLLLILSSFFHDIGMAPSEIDVISWKKIWDYSPEYETESEEIESNKFKRYCDAFPEALSKIQNLNANNAYSKADLLKCNLISDYIRITHSLRAKEIIQCDWENRIKYRDSDLTIEFAEICFSHSEDALKLLELDMNYLCGPNIYACLPLVGVILRLADILDFDAKRTPSILFSHLHVRNPISLKEWNKHRSIQAWAIDSKKIQFHAKCSHPAIEASIHAFCDLIDQELSICNNVITSINDFNRNIGRDITIQIPYKVDRSKIETKKDIFGTPLYLYRETQFNLSKNQVIDLLMGTKLYGDPEVALRELLQNSIDACLLRLALEKKWNNNYTPEIVVKYYTEKEEDILEVIDNGTGMDQYIIDTYYSKVGSSFYKSIDFYELKSKSNANFTPTSRFGIGILSCFMVADTLVVETRRVYGPHNSSKPINLTVEGQESIFWIKQGSRETPGTSTKLYLRKGTNPWDRMDETEFIQSVENVIPNPPFSITIKSKSNEMVRNENSFKDLEAKSLKGNLWNDHENIRQFDINLNDEHNGIIGSALIGILERHGMPIDKLEVIAKNVEIDGVNYELEKQIDVKENEIELSSTSITIDDESQISSSKSFSTLAKSKSRISLHGIEIPSSLFQEYWRVQKNQARLVLPFPALLVIDICGAMDLDLNSARTNIIISEKWTEFEEKLSYLVCNELSKQTNKEYWDQLKKMFLLNTKNESFINGLTNVKTHS